MVSQEDGEWRNRIPCGNGDTVRAQGTLHTVFHRVLHRLLWLTYNSHVGEKWKVRMKKGWGQVIEGLESQTKFRTYFESNGDTEGF